MASIKRRPFPKLLVALALVPALLVLARPAAAIEVQRFTSPRGIEAWLVQDTSNPILSLRFALRGGAAVEAKPGLANMLSALLDEGAGDYDSQAFQSALADNSISLSFSAGADSFSGSLSTLSRNQDLAFELMRLALTEPRFDEEPVERIRNQLLVSLARQEQDPDTLAWRTLRAALFPDHPYGRPTSGTPESVAAITVDDLRGYLADEIAQDRLFIGVSGDIDAETLGALLDKTFGGLPAESGAIEVADVTPHGEGGVMVIAREQPQSVVAMGQPGILRDDPDYYTAYTVNYVLGGGGFQSRLYDEVREKRGLAYSVYSYLNPLDHAGIVVAGTATANPRVSESLGLILDEWRRMAEEGPTEEELADAKTYLTGSFPLRLSSTGKIAGMLVGMQLEGLGIDYLDKRNSYIEAVTLEDAKRVAGELYRPEALSVVVVGQPEGIEATRELPGAI